MKINCEMARDLLPLYQDGVCSETSKAAVESHLNDCEDCRNLLKAVPLIPETELEMEEFPKAKESFQKIRKGWRASLLAVVLALPLLILCVNQIRGEGICFTNLDDIWTAKQFVSYLEKREYEKAAAMFDFSGSYTDIMAVLQKPVEEYMPNHIPFQIGEETWYVDGAFLEEVQPDGDPRNIWAQLIYIDRGLPVMIPEQPWKQIVDSENMLRKQVSNAYELCNGRVFYRMETAWGVFYFSDTAYQSFMQSEKQNLDYAQCSYLLPENMYQDIYPDILAYATTMHQRNRELYGSAEGLSQVEFEAYMLEKYAQELREGFADVSLSGNFFTDAFYTGENWQIEIKTTAAYTGSLLIHKGKSTDFWIGPHTQNGKVVSMGTMGTIDEWDDPITEALFPHLGF